jgi:NADH-quinone oxidoreductase subunit L
MLNLLTLVVVAPLIGFVVLTIARERLSERLAAIVGVGSVGLSALITVLVGYDFLATQPAGGAYTQLLWTWMRIGDFAPQFALKLDGLSLTMLGVITGVGSFIHLFAAWYMRGDDGFARFFSYMNLFVASMVLLVLGDDLLFVYFGWEGVGLCSYLLIGFWYKERANAAAARKAFVVTRVGDALMIIGLFILYNAFGTLHIDTLAQLAPQSWEVGSGVATITCLLLLGGAVGKSAQLPLQTWLADAMAGPTPVSALIHAATMVTAGVYLIARLHGLFDLSPVALEWVGIVGATTLLLAGFAALAQTDIKRILAYSTMSQIGYMFLAEGVGAYEPAVFHLMTHAFFKALLFLSAGSVILAMRHEQDIFRMGGLRSRLPFAFACMLIGTLALSAVPFTSGYYSKDEILHQAFLSGHRNLWLAGLLGAFLTAMYSFRLVFVVFFGPERWRDTHGAAAAEPQPTGALAHQIPLAVLLVLAVAGAVIHPPLTGVLPEARLPEADSAGRWIAHLPMVAAFGGIALSWWLFLKAPGVPARLAAGPGTAWLRVLWQHGLGFDWFYDRLLVRPFAWLAGVCRNDPIDLLVDAVSASSRGLHRLASLTQTGHLRWYAAVAGFGLCALIAIVATQ